jgi:hypothetical protein
MVGLKCSSVGWGNLATRTGLRPSGRHWLLKYVTFKQLSPAFLPLGATGLSSSMLPGQYTSFNSTLPSLPPTGRYWFVTFGEERPTTSVRAWKMGGSRNKRSPSHNYDV